MRVGGGLRTANTPRQPKVQAAYRDMARQWRELADHAEAIELRRPA